jgi:homoserine O-acetyltransferase
MRLTAQLLPKVFDHGGKLMKRLVALALLWSVSAFAQGGPSTFPQREPHDFTSRNFQFKTGDHMDTRIHYYTLGSPVKGADDRVGNAVLILHGTGGSGTSLLGPTFAGMLFCSGCLLDATKYFIISPDNLGHGSSSKPSDGMRMGFPHYDYDDMVALQHKLLTEGLNVDHLRLVIGTSMGCMQSWLWAEQYPDFIDAAMPLACLPIEIAGRNRMWRKMIMDGIRNDPLWNNGNYTQEPQEGLRIAEYMLLIAGSAPLFNQTQAPTRQATDDTLDRRFSTAVRALDANDVLYQIDSSRDYNPNAKLETIRVPVMAVNSADDFINPPELGILEREIRRVKRGCAVVLPISDQTRGHGTHTIATVWGYYLAELLQKSGGLKPGTSWNSLRSSSADERVCSVAD